MTKYLMSCCQCWLVEWPIEPVVVAESEALAAD
jgi:hypothetical protein